jgi:hypothetical protein
MPLARIITGYPEHIADLSQQLQREGFSVEVAAPDQIHLQPADLEIDFAICNPAEVLQQAARRATELRADVVVASGVLELATQPAVVAPVELEPTKVVEIQAQPQPTQAVPVQAAPIEVIPVQSAEEEFSHELPAYNPHFAVNLGTQLRESLSDLGVAAAELSKRLVEHLRTAAASIRSRMAAAKANRAFVAESLAGQHAEAQEQSANLLAEQQEPELEKQRELAASAASQQQLPLPASASAPVRRPKMAHVRRTQLQLRGIFTGAAAASVLFIVGIVLANLHPQHPLPASMTQTSVEQHVPFGAIIVQGTSAKPAANVPQPKIVPPHANLQPRVNSQTPAPKKPHPYRTRLAAHENEDDVTADDVVVRHFPAQVRRPPAQQQAKLRRYSDLN